MTDNFAKLSTLPTDAIFNLAARAKAAEGKKANLIVGAYRNQYGEPNPLKVVRTAEQRLLDAKLDYEYLPILGHPGFIDASLKLLYGDSVERKYLVGAQTLSGTGAIWLGAKFLALTYDPKKTPVYISDPTWPNHRAVFQMAGWTQVRTYRYYNESTRGLNYEGLKEDIQVAPKGSVFVMHECAHNPTGVDPTHKQWEELAVLFLAKGHQVFFDSAYQGYASGDLDHDAFALRHFVSKGIQLLCSQSYAKNLGLYNERVGTLSVVLKDSSRAAAVSSHLAFLARTSYSNPPAHGARIAHLVLSDPQLRKDWQEELIEMSGRIKAMRQEVYGHLKRLKTPGTWEHVIDQIGMFSYLGLTKEQCQYCQDHNVFITLTGRANMAGVTVDTAKLLAETIDAAVRNKASPKL